MGIAHKNNEPASGEANHSILLKIVRKSRHCGKPGFRGIMLLAAFLLWLGPAYGAGTITEDFTNNQYNTSLWNLWNMGAETTAQVTNNRLEVTVAGNGYAGLDSSGFTLIGDFDMFVEFTMIDWPASNGTQITMGTFNSSWTNTFQVGRANAPLNSSGEEQYFTVILNNYNGTGVTGPTSHGTLWMSRTGNKMEGFYWDGTAWQSIGSATNAGLGTRVGVSLSIGPYGGTYSGTSAKAAFANIQINYTTLGPSSWQGNTGPALMLLLSD
jgi:hypothetical protein